MAESVFDRVGGEHFFIDLVDGFYLRVEDDPVLRPMYPTELGPAKERLSLFLIQYFGGPRAYEERRGEPKLRYRHLRFAIDTEARNHWMEHMTASLKALGASPDVETEMIDYFEEASKFFMNKGLAIGGR